MPFRYAIAPRKIALILAVIALILAAESLYSEYLVETYGGGSSSSVLGPVLDLFSVNLEQSLPTWYATLILFTAGVLLAVIAAAKQALRDRYRLYWIGLAVIFFYLSLDENAVIHEILSDPLQTTFHTSGYLAFGWQMVAAPLVVILALVYLRFLLHLTAGTRNLFILAGGLYVGGALIVDAVSANEWVQDNGITLGYLAIGTLEELLEMQGIVVFIYALLRSLVSMNYAVTFHSGQEPSADLTGSARSSGSPASGRLRVFVLVLIVVAVVINAVFLYWARSEEPTTPAASQDALLAYQAVLSQPGTEPVVVTRTAGMFGLEPMLSQRVAAAHLTLFDQVMVITLPTADASLILAGDRLPFDQAALSDILRANGVTQFIVFDTPAVRQMATTP
ncbi:MAG: hypothetical protein K8J31_25570 [Anaerolineae bacterium]|nr:hypothetical protein [Anaerolineae bacterium]